MKKSEVRNQNYTSIYNTEKASKRWFQPIFTQIWILHVLSTSKSILSFISRVSHEKTVIRHPLTVWKCFPKPLWGMGRTLVSTLFGPLKIKKKGPHNFRNIPWNIFIVFSKYLIDSREETNKNNFFEINNEKIRSPESN